MSLCNDNTVVESVWFERACEEGQPVQDAPSEIAIKMIFWKKVNWLNWVKI
jgi:hypothetical protein